jgi:S-adenosylmethionine decarboxylase
MRGLHLTADLYRCRCEAALADRPEAGRLVPCRPCQRSACRSTSCSTPFPALHGRAASRRRCCWPNRTSACTPGPSERRELDVYVCNFSGDHSAKARGLMFALVQRFQPEWTEQRSLDRGEGDE